MTNNLLSQTETLTSTINDKHANLLDRVDACLELSQLVEKDINQRARLINKARDLLKTV